MRDKNVADLQDVASVEDPDVTAVEEDRSFLP